MELLIPAAHFFAIFGLAWWVWKKETSTIRKFYWPALLLKLLAGIALGIVYTVYYPESDVVHFFKAAVELSQEARTDFSGYLNTLFSQADGYYLGEARTLFFVKVASVITLFANANFWITSLYFSLISFLAAWKLAKSVALYFPEYALASAIAFLFLPSCVFWSSGMIKEALAMAGMYLLATVFLKIWMKDKVSLLDFLVVVLSAWVVWKVKYYFIALFIPIMVVGWTVRKLIINWKIKSIGAELLLWLGLLMLGLVAVTFVHPNFLLNRLPDVVVNNYQSFIRISSPHDVIRYFNLEATWVSMMVNSPWAMFSGLFRPFLWEADSIFKGVAALENVVLLILSLLALPSLMKLKTSPHRWLVVSLIAYCLLLCTFLALSTPNFGTLVRYRVGFLPFLVVLIANRPLFNKVLSKFL